MARPSLAVAQRPFERGHESEDGPEGPSAFMARPSAFMVPRSPPSLKFSLRAMGLLGITICVAAITVGAGTFALFKNNNSDSWLAWIDKLQKPAKYEVAGDSSQKQSKTASQAPAQVSAVASGGSPSQQTASVMPSQAGARAIASGSPSGQLSPEDLAELANRGRELLAANIVNTAPVMPSQAGSQEVASGPPSPHSKTMLAITDIGVSSSPEDTAAQVGVCAIVAKPADFNHQTVTLQGTATALKETTSHRGNDYTTFKLQDPSGCGAVSVFTWGHAAMSNGDQVRVEGVFETVHRVRQYTFHNEVEATKVTPVPPEATKVTPVPR
jgi:hypothetical protein